MEEEVKKMDILRIGNSRLTIPLGTKDLSIYGDAGNWSIHFWDEDGNLIQKYETTECLDTIILEVNSGVKPKLRSGSYMRIAENKFGFIHFKGFQSLSTKVSF